MLIFHFFNSCHEVIAKKSYFTACIDACVFHFNLAEANLIGLNGEQLRYRSAITGDEARLDILARSFWVRGQEAFLDIRVFDPNTNRYLDSTLPRCHKINEEEKKKVTIT